jgi:glycosyltransferase involved in cell wall biosynthesis
MAMNIAWLSNSPWTPSGYGQQTRIFVPRLQAIGHRMGILAFYGLEGGILNLNGITVYPKGFHPYGNDIAVPHSRNFGADIMMSLMDTWVMDPEHYPPTYKWIPWYPVDHDPIPPLVRHKISLAYRRICFSKFGVEQTHKAGLDCHYIPHGVETKVMYPKDKNEAREKLNLPKDKWLVGTVAMNKGSNPSRKNFSEMIEAFASFHKRHPESAYILNTMAGENSNEMVNLPELIYRHGLKPGVDVQFCNQYLNFIGFPPDYFRDFYSALDVHLLVSSGEGFGIPILEAQACGCPVIVGDWTAMSELCFAGRMIDKKDAFKQYTNLSSWQYRPIPRAIDLALEAEYQKPSKRERAVRMAQEYDADYLIENYWKPILGKIEEDARAGAL